MVPETVEECDSETERNRLVTLSIWRTTQGVYLLDPDLAEALWDTPMTNGQLPIELLWRVPEWCPYIHLGGFTPQWFSHIQKPGIDFHAFLTELEEESFSILGFWVYLKAHALEGKYRPDTGFTVCFLMDVLVDTKKQRGLPYLVYHAFNLTAGGSLDDSIQNACNQKVDPILTAPLCQLAGSLLSVSLYLCATNSRTLDGFTDRPQPQPVKTSKGLRLFPPAQPTLWRLGASLGAALRASRAQDSGEAHTTTRPHLRRAHWHSYWVGPRGGPTRQLELRWLHPILVNPQDSEELLATVRPVCSPLVLPVDNELSSSYDNAG